MYICIYIYIYIHAHIYEQVHTTTGTNTNTNSAQDTDTNIDTEAIDTLPTTVPPKKDKGAKKRQTCKEKKVTIGTDPNSYFPGTRTQAPYP